MNTERSSREHSAANVRRFRKKPVEVEAVRFTDNDSLSLIEWWSKQAVYYSDTDGVRIDTLEGTLYVQDGDWVVRGVQGEFYPVKPDIFEQTYEAVDA